jgi:hypothetical protein
MRALELEVGPTTVMIGLKIDVDFDPPPPPPHPGSNRAPVATTTSGIEQRTSSEDISRALLEGVVPDGAEDPVALIVPVDSVKAGLLGWFRLTPRDVPANT